MKLDKSVIKAIVEENLFETELDYRSLKKILEELNLVFKPDDQSQSLLVKSGE